MGDTRAKAGREEAPTIDELIQKRHWTVETVRHVVELVAQGELAAKEAVIRRLRPRCELGSELVKDLVAIHSTVVADPNRGLDQARNYLTSGVSLSPCARAQVLGISSQALRMIGDIPAADSALAQAWATAGDCEFTALDLHRRTVLVRFAAQRVDEAFFHANSAVGGYRQVGGPGHDLRGEGLARSLLNRGQLRGLSGDYHGALEDQAEAVSIISAKSEEVLSAATFDLSVTLSRLGPEAQKIAFDYVLTARQYFRRRDRSVQRARLDWLEGSLRWRLREDAPRGKWLLKRAQQDFIGFKMPYEVSGVTADLLRILYPSREVLRTFLAEWQPRLFGFLRGELWTAFLAVVDAVEDYGWDAESLVDRAIASFRATASLKPGVPPCLLVAV